ncbi:hypothetical protein [Dactylosporangium sp. CA-139066]|uniref:hypothetical protein n=1 Tax=Dactylosporangium sp. CA-139066 TaxID=3239930 RepID=UPI003D8A5DB7
MSPSPTPANGIATPVDVYGANDFAQHVSLQPGGTATVTVPPSGSSAISVYVQGFYLGHGAFVWPAGCLPAGPAESDRLHDGESLVRGQAGKDRITSPDGRFSLVLQALDGNVVLYEYGKRPLWSSGIHNSAAWASLDAGMLSLRDNLNVPIGWNTFPSANAPATLVVQNDGNAVVYRDSDHAVLWATNTCCHAPAPPSPAPGAHQLKVGQALPLGGQITSPNGVYRLVLQDFDGNLVLYKNGTKALWAFGPRFDSYFKNQTDGNLVAYLSEGPAVWASNTSGKGAGTLVLQDDGNLVLYRNSDHGVIWATNTYGK